MINSQYFILLIWLAPQEGMMNQIARCVWLPERTRGSHLACSGLPAVSHKQTFPKSHIISALLTKFVRSRWLDIGLVLFSRVYGPRRSINDINYVLPCSYEFQGILIQGLQVNNAHEIDSMQLLS